MEHRAVERLDRSLGVIGLGTWQLAADRGEVGDEAAERVPGAVVSAGFTALRALP